MSNAYHTLLRALRVTHTDLRLLLSLLPDLHLTTRKAILSLTRTQSMPLEGSTTLSRLREDLDISVTTKVEGTSQVVRLLPLLQRIYLIQSPVYSGFISMMIRNAPFADYGSVLQSLESTIQKEMLAAMETFHPVQFDWYSLLAPSQDKPRPLLPGYPCDPAIFGGLRSALVRAKRRLSSATLYPDYGRKSIGREAALNLSCLSRTMIGYEEEPTTRGLERLYHRTGIEICGSTELRWSWKYNDLKPRLYYARGPDVYYASRYIQAVFNEIVDSLPATHRYERHHHASLHLEASNDLFIYDYASFTSKLHEIRNFTHALSDFFRDTEVVIVDTLRGPMIANLGGIIAEFNDACNDFPLFDIWKISGQFFNHFLRHTLPPFRFT